MNTFFKNILVLAAMLGTYTSYANTPLEVTTTSNMVSKGDLISVTNASGEIIYSGQVNYNGSIKNLYDFSQLENGTYTIEINKAFEININSVEVKNNVVTFIENSDETIFKPVFRSENSRVIISKLAIDSKEMTVELYFEDNLIHSETVKGSEILNRVYKLDENLKGEYKAIIRANNRVFVENFKL